jgi:hypothetical protein
MSSDDQNREHAAAKAEIEYLRTEIRRLWQALARAQGEIARIHQDRINDLLANEPAGDRAKLN